MAQDTLNPNAVNLTGSVAEAGASHSNRVSGIIVDDPARSMPIGSNVCLSPVLVTHPEKHPATWLQNWACLDGIMLALTFNDEEENFLEGSAVLIGPGIAMCAWHVIEPRFAAVMAGKEAVTCFGVAPEGVRMWWVRKLTRVPDSDLCILGLELATSFEPGQVLTFSTVTTRLPQVGEELLIIGFRAGARSFPRSPECPEVEMAAGILMCRGAVTAKYETGRDRVLLPWPCLEVACPSWGGMSGGPVYDYTGKLVGLLSSSMTTDDCGGPSNVSLVWPALAAPFEGGWPSALFSGPSRLVDQRLCAIDRRDAVRYTIDPQNGQYAISYVPW